MSQLSLPHFGGHLVWRSPPNKKVASGPGRPRYSVEFKTDAVAVAMVIDGERTVADVAKALGLVEQTLGNWVRQARVDRGDKAGLTTDDRIEMTRLRRENSRLTMALRPVF